MKQLSEVSETALITLRSRVAESRKEKPVLQDPIGRELYQKLMEALPAELRKRVLERKLSPVLSKHLALRARKYDALCHEFLEKYPDGLIVSLGCGFDTRFWRLGGEDLKYLELDLPSVIQSKKQLLGERINYQTMGTSVLEKEWIGKVKEMQPERVLFIAEGLFMYLPKEKVIRTLTSLAAEFSQSRIVMEVIAEKYTRGFRKKMVEKKMRKGAGSTAGDFYQYGIRSPKEPEAYHPGIKLNRVWSYYEDPDIKPAFLKIFKHIKSIAQTQYTVILDIT
jgi:methyltransferase (TIGR00027 family)